MDNLKRKYQRRAKSQKETNMSYLTEDETKELDARAREVIKWLNDHGHPHTSITIHTTGYELKEGIISTDTITDYLKD